jgi:hypothetical protein
LGEGGHCHRYLGMGSWSLAMVVVATAGSTVHSSDIDKRGKKKDSPLRCGPGRGGRRPSCIRCSRVLKNLLTPFFFCCFWGHFRCVGVGAVVAVNMEERGSCRCGCGRAGHWVHSLDRHKRKNKKNKKKKTHFPTADAVIRHRHPLHA